jgi:hypothetical protein
VNALSIENILIEAEKIFQILVLSKRYWYIIFHLSETVEEWREFLTSLGFTQNPGVVDTSYTLNFSKEDIRVHCTPQYPCGVYIIMLDENM